MKVVEISTAKIAYRIFGTGKTQVVIEGSLNSCNAEWWNMCQKATDLTFLVYDRAGYGESTRSLLERTPTNIVLELNELLLSLKVEDPIVLVGHSQGGLYSTLFALKYPLKVKALILLDPLSFSNFRFQEELTKKEYDSSGVDKTQMLKIGKLLTQFGLGFLFKGLIKKSPPFYYAKYEKEAEQYILNSLIKHKQYLTALDEYLESQKKANLLDFKGHVTCPMSIIVHSSEKMIKEIEYFGNVEYEMASKIDILWQGIMKDMLKVSKGNSVVIAENSSHYIHLTDEDLVIESIRKFV